MTHIEFVSVDHGSTHAEPVEVAREAIWMIDADAAGMTFDPEVEYQTIPRGILAQLTYLGFGGLRRLSIDFFGAWDELAVEPQEVREAGDDLVIGVVRVNGRMHEVKIEEIWSALFTLRNARIVRVQAFGSREGAFEAAALREWRRRGERRCRMRPIRQAWEWPVASGRRASPLG